MDLGKDPDPHSSPNYLRSTNLGSARASHMSIYLDSKPVDIRNSYHHSRKFLRGRVGTNFWIKLKYNLDSSNTSIKLRRKNRGLNYPNPNSIFVINQNRHASYKCKLSFKPAQYVWQRFHSHFSPVVPAQIKQANRTLFYFDNISSSSNDNNLHSLKYHVLASTRDYCGYHVALVCWWGHWRGHCISEISLTSEGP
jgi:hypothetical protein